MSSCAHAGLQIIGTLHSSDYLREDGEKDPAEGER